MKKFISDNWMMIVLTIGAFILYGLVMALGVPKEFAAPFRDNSSLLFLIVLALYFLIFRLSNKLSWGIGLTFTLLLFAFALLHLWTSGYSNNGIIGGLLPYKDGKYYYWGVQMIMNGDVISSKGVQAAGRPLFPGFISIFLFLVGGNLKFALALIAGFCGLAAFISAFYFSRQLGAAAAAVYITLLFLYIQGLLGFTMSELAGFIFGCLGLVLMWKAAKELKVGALIIGLVVTMLAVSIRTGAFFLFPMLILWAGWAFRGEKKFSLRVGVIAAITVGLTFIVLNVIYPKVVVEPGAMTNGNFAYALYGQVRGGVGWNEAIKATGTRDPNVVYRAAWDFFKRHPLSFPLGILKSYRDFFAPKSGGIFPMDYSISGIILHLIGLASIVATLALFPKRRTDNTYLMLLASFIGICLSIPFLPPVDGGSRFYASTMSFFFLFVAYPFSMLFKQVQTEDKSSHVLERFAAILSLVSLVLILGLPILLQRTDGMSKTDLPQCPSGQIPFMTRITPGSYIDLSNDTSCGLVPNVCLHDFEANGVDATTDDFYQELVKQASAMDTVARVTVYNNFADESVHYLLGTAENLHPENTDWIVVGCAVEIKTEHQSIYKVKETFTP